MKTTVQVGDSLDRQAERKRKQLTQARVVEAEGSMSKALARVNVEGGQVAGRAERDEHERVDDVDGPLQVLEASVELSVAAVACSARRRR